MLIRAATPIDIPNMVALERVISAAAHWSDAHYQQLFAADAPRRIVLVACENDLCGFIILKEAAGDWELENIAVREADRRQGCANALLRRAVELIGVDERTRIFLEVRASNSAALGFYRKHGFQEVGRRPSYYQDPIEDAVLLALTLVINFS